MELALATGRGPRLLSDLDGLGPLVRDEDVAVLGYRDAEPLPGSVTARDVVRLRLAGIEQTVRRQVAALRREGVRGFWIHLDADVLDPTFLPAVDTPEPGGLHPGELVLLLRELLRSEMAAGMQLCIYDPDRDPGGGGARTLAELLAAAFEPQAGGGPGPAGRSRGRRDAGHCGGAVSIIAKGVIRRPLAGVDSRRETTTNAGTAKGPGTFRRTPGGSGTGSAFRRQSDEAGAALPRFNRWWDALCRQHGLEPGDACATISHTRRASRSPMV